MNRTVVIIEPEKLKKVKTFVQAVIQEKKKEGAYQKDYSQKYKRFLTGMLGEAALEHFLKKEFMDWTVGDSRVYNVADLKALSLNVGIKTVEYGKFPIIHKRATRPEIILIRNPKREDQVVICGLATIEVLNTYQNDDLIIDPKLRAKGTKTGFYGFKHLIPFRNLEELKKVCT